MQDTVSDLTAVSEADEPDDSGLSVGHLQLQSVLNDDLIAGGRYTIADVLIFAASPAFNSYRFRNELADALHRLGQCTTGNSVDWRKYWMLGGMQFHHLSASLPELDRLSPWSAALPLSVDSFGKSALPLSRDGFRTLGTLRLGLRAGIPHVVGLGPGRRTEFFERLIAIADSVDAAGDVRHAAWRTGGRSEAASSASRPEGSDDAGAGSEGSRALGPEVSNLPVGILHLGQKAVWLRQAGLLTIGQVSRAWPAGVGRVPNIGPTTLELVGQRLSALDQSVAGDQVDWDRYCELTGVPLLPEAAGDESGEAFLASLPSVLGQVAARLDDDLDAAILLRRIAKPPGEQDTLEDLAQASSAKVTRERVRQKERRLLTGLARGLMWDDYGSLDVHFRPAFSRWWKTAAAEFRDNEEITFTDFVERLSAVWGASPAAVMRQAPIIMAIVTGDAQMPASFRSGFRIDHRLYVPLPASTRDVKLTKLRLGKYALDLAEYGVATPGDLITLCRTGRIADIESRASREALSHLSLVADCLDGNGAIDWQAYRAKFGLSMLPAQPVSSPFQFAADLTRELEDLLRKSGITPRAADIFRIRSARGHRERPTLQEVADRLDTHGPTIKREETIFLEFLNDVVLGREFTSLPVWLDETWLGYWSAAQEMYQRSGADYEVLAGELARCWQLPSSVRDNACPAIWAVLTGYPDGRRPARRRAQPAPPANAGVPPDTDRIRLTGFQRLH